MDRAMDRAALLAEVKELLVTGLRLDRPATDIPDDSPIFGEGLGLDSIDALELALAISKRWGVRIKADDERNREIFRSVHDLAAFIDAERTRQGTGS